MLFDPVSGNPQAVEFDYLTPRWDFLDPKLKADFESINREAKGWKARPRPALTGLRYGSISLVATTLTGNGSWLSDGATRPTYYRFDRKTKKLTECY